MKIRNELSKTEVDDINDCCCGLSSELGQRNNQLAVAGTSNECAMNVSKISGVEVVSCNFPSGEGQIPKLAIRFSIDMTSPFSVWLMVSLYNYAYD